MTIGQHGALRTTVESIADELYRLRGFRKTKLSVARSVGDTTLIVDSIHRFGMHTSPGLHERLSAIETVITSPHVTAPHQDEFGWSVRADRRTLTVGAIEQTVATNGRLYAYPLQENGTWGTPETLVASDGSAGDKFGWAHDIEDDFIVVGAPGDDTNRGAIYFFKRANNAFAQVQKIVASDGAAQDLFGRAARLSYPYLIVGAPGDDNALGADAGAAYLYTYDPATGLFDSEQKILDATGAAADAAGTSVDVNAGTLTVVVGSLGGGANGGAVSVYVIAAGVPTFLAPKLVGNDAAGDNFACSLSLGYNTLAVGASYPGALGKLFFFRCIYGTWALKTTKQATDGAADDRFGESVDTNGPLIAVSAPYDDDNGTNSGSVYLFVVNDDDTITEQRKVKPFATYAANHAFGCTHHGGVAIREKWLTCGANAVSGAATFQVHQYALEEVGQVAVEEESLLLGYVAQDKELGNNRFLGCDALKREHPAHSEVVDLSRASTQLDALRAATIVERAQDTDLDRIGRNHAVKRLRSFTDDLFREVIKTIAYTYRGTMWTIEMLLDALYPDQAWAIYENRVEHPCEVFITIPGEIGSDPLGRWFMPAEEVLASTDATHVTLTKTPRTVELVKLVPIEQTLTMAALPSTLGWSFVAESAGIEAAYFSIVSGELVHHHPAGTDSGRYERSIPQLEAIAPVFHVLEGAWKSGTPATVGGYPWKLIVQDGSYEYALIWNDAGLALGQSDETIVAGPIAVTLDDNTWKTFKLVKDGTTIRAFLNGVEQISEDVSLFALSAGTVFSFGYTDNGHANEWDVLWDEVRFYTRSTGDYWHPPGTVIGATLTLGTSLPAAVQNVTVDYTTELSGIILTDESTPREDAYPAYIQGVSEEIEALIDSITAAGVIPKFFLNY
jgi:hypothetical protein